MTPQRIPGHEVIHTEELRELAATAGPCISVAIQIPDPLQIRTRIKNSISAVEKSLASHGVDDDTAGTLLEPIRSLALTVETSGQWRRDLVICRSMDRFRYSSVLELAKEYVRVGDCFEIRPLLSLIGREQQFYILALSQKHVRLIRATYHHVEEVSLRGFAPQNLAQWLNERAPDHVLDNRATGGQSAGSMKGVVFTTSTEQEQHGEHLAHFFREIDSGIRKVLGSGDTPMMLAGVVSETKLYARVNTYPGLIDRTVEGSPEKMPIQELQKRAAEIAKHTFTRPLSKSLQDIKRQQRAGRVLTGTDAILKAAKQGRIADLLIREDAEWLGAWDETTQEVRPGNQDLMNLAAIETLSHGGQAFELGAVEMPEPASMVALLRF